MPLWVQDQAVHWPDVPHPSQSPRGELEKSVSGQTERQAWGGGIPEPEAARQGVGRRGQTASALGFSLLFHLTGIRAQSWLAP